MVALEPSARLPLWTPPIRPLPSHGLPRLPQEALVRLANSAPRFSLHQLCVLPFSPCARSLTPFVIATSNVVDMHLCNYYHPTLRSCGNRDFMASPASPRSHPTWLTISSLAGHAILRHGLTCSSFPISLLFRLTPAWQVMALFALSQSRLFSAFSSIVWIIVVAATILPLRTPYVRNGSLIAYRKDVARPLIASVLQSSTLSSFRDSCCTHIIVGKSQTGACT